MPMQAQTARDHAYLQTRQALLNQLADSTASGVKLIIQAGAYPSLDSLSDACMEAIDFLLNFAAESDKANEPDQVNMLLKLSSNHGPVMEKLRKSYMSSDKLGSANDKGLLLDLTIMIEKTMWLVNRLVSLTPPENKKRSGSR